MVVTKLDDRLDNKVRERKAFRILQGFWFEQLKDGIAICKAGEEGSFVGGQSTISVNSQ